jgi:hypothetical protein
VDEFVPASAANAANTATVSGASSLAKGRSAMSEACKSIVAVGLTVQKSERKEVSLVFASYAFADPTQKFKCDAPVWAVSPKAPRKIELLDGGFTAVMRFPIEAYKIVATAPNGVQGAVLSGVQDN